MTPSDQMFLLVIPGYNARPFLADLVASLSAQRWTLWQAVFVDDCSSDGTLGTLRNLLAAHSLTDRFDVVQIEQRRYKACNVFHALQNRGQPGDVVVMLDADDHLATPEALHRLAREYEQGWDVVWSNWRGSDGSRGTSAHLNPFIDPRRQPLVSSHLFSFRRRLFDAVLASDLQDDDGRWFDAGCDVALAWPILDQTIKRKHIEDVLCIYNCANPLSHDKLNRTVRPLVSPAQARTAAILRRRSGKPLVVDQEFLHSHLYELLQAAMLSQRALLPNEIAAAIARQAGISGRRPGGSDAAT